ncbi:Protein of unknown function [Clostridium amylolyticum]|uniref:DUF3006 domain-containing protein n=1 Tax=Clostridium amylolyticum TaxID=1121298 RepID=A0A1M6JK50_9CLOT|nr:DUF3006 domain-containing protein [Clostridium amylolyticum]SHJ47078.1 Protein of unknown function [Clostridium amylolyticum]
MQHKVPLIVDRIEDNFIVVCEDYQGNIVNIDRRQIEDKVKEGDVIIIKDGKYKIHAEATFKRRKDMEDLVKSMWVEDEGEESE